MIRKITIDRRLRTAASVTWFLVGVWSLPFGLGQNTPALTTQRTSMHDLRTAPGVSLARGSNTAPVGPLKLLSFFLDEVTLPQAEELIIRGRKQVFHSALRLTI